MTTSDSPRILLIMAAEDDRVALRRLLDRAGIGGDVSEEADPDRALARSSEPFDCILVEHRPRATGTELLRAMRERGVKAPILLLLERLDEEVERDAADAGASDFLVREELSATRLGCRIRQLVRIGHAEAETAEMLAKAQGAAAARDQLLAIVSHDLRSPLNAIVLACDALETDPGESDRRRYIAAIRRAGQRAERLLRDLLDVSRIESGALRLERRAVSARSILDQTRLDHEILARDAGSQILVDADADPGQVFADRDRVLQVLANLVGNALKHAAGSQIRLGAHAVDGVIEISVADQGPGIVADALPHVFDRFWQGRKRRGGAGLGLAIAKGIVEAHGGAIEVWSEVGKGTRFAVRLPRPPPAAK